MEPIQESLTWRQIQELFDADDEYGMLIDRHLRRTKKWRRKRGEADDRRVVRLTIQKRISNNTKTVFRKNLKGLTENYLDVDADPKIVDRINGVLAGLAAV